MKYLEELLNRWREEGHVPTYDDLLKAKAEADSFQSESSFQSERNELLVSYESEIESLRAQLAECSDALHRIDMAVIGLLPTFEVAHEGGVAAAAQNIVSAVERAGAQLAAMVPEIDYEALIAAAVKRDRKWAQGTNGCVAFKCGAEWFRDVLLAAAPDPTNSDETSCFVEVVHSESTLYEEAVRGQHLDPEAPPLIEGEIGIVDSGFVFVPENSVTTEPYNLLEVWEQAYAAFKGAFDTPLARRRESGEFSEDARKRLREFDEAIRSSAPGAVPPDTPPKVFAWATFDGEGSYDLRLYENNESYRDDYIKRNGEKYASWVIPLSEHPVAHSEPVSRSMAVWCEYVAGMVCGWLGMPVDDPKIKAVAGIIERRLWAMPKSVAQGEPVLFVSEGQLAAHTDAHPDHGAAGNYIPARKTPAGNFTTPLYTHPQQVSEPMTAEQISDYYFAQEKHGESTTLEGFSEGVRFAERHHQIKGKQ